MGVNAGHGIDYENIKDIFMIPRLNELNIGFSIIAESVFIGLDKAVRKMVRLMKSGHPSCACVGWARLRGKSSAVVRITNGISAFEFIAVHSS
jgi:hypothetical protein